MEFNTLSNQNMSPNFGAMKKSQFKGIDLFCVNAFKAPIEKFNSNLDLQKWADAKLTTDVFDNHINARSHRATIERTSIFESWLKFFDENKDVPKTAALVAIKSLFGGLKLKTDDVPPPLDTKIFQKTLNDVAKKPQFNFQKEYVNNLITDIIGDKEKLAHGWVKIPSKDNDPKHFSKHVTELKLLSDNAWCTKSTKAEEYLEKGNFYILYDNYKPILGIRTDDNRILEIQGHMNNSDIPVNSIGDVLKVITEERLDSSMVGPLLDSVYDKSNEIDRCKKRWGDLIKNNDGPGILEKFAIYIDETPEGKVLTKYKPFDFGVTLGDMGINENNLFKDIVKINDDANFANSHVTSLPNLKVINGDANFRDSRVKNISALEEIRGSVYLGNSQLIPEDFANVKILGKIFTK